MNLNPHPQLTLSLAGQPAPSLANFVTGQNQAAVDRLRCLLTGDFSERFIYLWGPVGSGRSHLLQACAAQPAITCIDNCEALSDASAHGAFVLFTQALTEPSKAIVVAADRPAAHLALRADLQSRMAQCLSFEIKPLSDKDLRLALAVAIAERGLEASPDILNYLLNRLPRNMPALKAALDALDNMSLQRKAPISLALARELLGSKAD